MSSEGFHLPEKETTFSDIFPEKESMLTEIVNRLETTPEVRVVDLYTNENERRKVSNILTVLKFLNIVTFSGKQKDKIVKLNSTHRLLWPVRLADLPCEIELATQKYNTKSTPT